MRGCEGPDSKRIGYKGFGDRGESEPTGLHLETNYALSECVFFNVIG